MSSFYSYSYGKRSSAPVAMDEQEEKMVTIRRIFRIDPKAQKVLGHEEKPEETKDKPRTTAEDMAIYLGGFAMDLSPRHSKTPIEACRAKDPRYCPYHGADYMTKALDEEFRKAGIYAAGGVERLGQGKFKVQYSVPESKKAAANGIIDKFLASPGFVELDAEDKKDAELVDSIGDLGDDVGRGFRTDRGNDDFAMREEHLDMLERDMNDGMAIDPSELYQLRKDHHELKKLGKAAWEAANAAGIDPKVNSKASREWKDSSETWQAYRAASQKFSDDYNYVRANADLSYVKTPEDCKELMGHLEKQITQAGDFVKASEEVETLKEKKGVKGKKGIPGMKEFNDARGKIRFAIDGLKTARKQAEDANASGDVKKMRAAAHSLELVLNQVKEGKDAIAESLKQAESFRKYLEGLPDVGEGSGKPSEKVAEKAKPKSTEEEKEPGKKEPGKKESASSAAPAPTPMAGTAVRKYLDALEKGTFARRFGLDKYNEISDLADKAKEGHKSLEALIDVPKVKGSLESGMKSIRAVVGRLGGIASPRYEDGEGKAPGKVLVAIPPDKAHELYMKLDARGVAIPAYKVGERDHSRRETKPGA